MWIFGLLFLTILVYTKSLEAEISMEAAFQGRCGRGSPCVQLCYELHDGMYECDCEEGYELDKNGYSCHEINSTYQPNDDANINSNGAEDVLYQKGASFSAKLDNSHNINNHLDDNDTSDDNDSAETFANSLMASNEDASLISDKLNAKQTPVNMNGKSNSKNNVAENGNHRINSIEKATMISSTTTDSTATTMLPGASTDLWMMQQEQEMEQQKQQQQLPKQMVQHNYDNSYNSYNSFRSSSISKEDMSVYDDVNNNQLNLRNLPSQQLPPTLDNFGNYPSEKSERKISDNRNNDTVKSYIHIEVYKGVMNDGGVVTKVPENTVKLESFQANSTLFDKGVTRKLCQMDCGVDGVCDNTNGVDRCLCPYGKFGLKCEQDIKINVPRFTRNSWMAFPALRGAYKHVQLHIEFRPESFNGIILLTGERDDLTGDFMAVLIHQGFIEFWFDCGSGTGKVKSEETVVLNQWNTVTVYRHRWDAWLLLNGGSRVQGRSKGLFSRITFREPVFLGGTGNITGLAKRLPVYDGMTGCIRKFIANEHEYSFSAMPSGDITQGFDVQECTTDRCGKFPCRHDGKCLPSDQGSICLCPLGFGGDLCEMRLDLQVPSFNGSSYLRYAPLGDSSLIWFELKMVIKPLQEDGLLLYSGHHEYGDYISLYLHMGFIEFSFDLGSGPAVVRSELPLTLGHWHTISVSRTARLAVLKVDQLPEVMTISPNGFWHLSLPHSLYLGGVQNYQNLPSNIRGRGESFIGCIQKVEINGRSISIISEALSGMNVDNCPHACVARPCGPFAKCVPILENYECQCNPSNVQCNKAEEVMVPVPKNAIVTNPINMEQVANSFEVTVPSLNDLEKVTNEPLSFFEPSTSASDSLPLPSLSSMKPTRISRVPVEHLNNNMNPLMDNRQPDNNPHQNSVTNGNILHNDNVEDDDGNDNDDDYDDDYYYYEDEKNYSESLNNGKDNNAHVVENAFQASTPLADENYNFAANDNDGSNGYDGGYVGGDRGDGDSGSVKDNGSPLINNQNYQKESIAQDNSNKYKNTVPFIDKGKDASVVTRVLGKYMFVDNEKLLRKTKLDNYYQKETKENNRKKSKKKPMKAISVPSDSIKNIGAEQFNIYSGEDILSAKELIDDMERIMKNGNDIRQEALLSSSSISPSFPSSSSSSSSSSSLSSSSSSSTSSFMPVGKHRTKAGRMNHGACFTGTDSYFHYSDRGTMRQIDGYKIDLNLRFKTHSNNGLMLWTGQRSSYDGGDFLSLGIENGYLHLRYNLGSGEANIEYNATKISDGLWHRLRATRNSQEHSLEVDGGKTIIERSPSKLQQLNTDSGLYVGGMPDVYYYTRRKYTSGIIGCISEIVLSGELRLSLHPDSLGTAHNVEPGLV